MKKLLKEAIISIKPGKKYETEVLGKANSIIKKINSGLSNVTVQLGGSGAKGTWLKTFDADIFVKFDYKEYRNNSAGISDILEEFLKKHYKIKRLHGSRDYFQIHREDFTFEIIPIIDIKKSEQALNITDVSPLHSNFVLKHKKLRNEMRLTKQFFKAAHVYGAESHIKGFSGYVCEILTIYYGSFEKTIKAVSKWKFQETIDVKNFFKKKNIFMELNKSKLNSPLIVIDPVQKDRNASAALDNEKFEIIISRAKEFLKKPSIDFFTINLMNEDDLRKKFRKNLIIFKAVSLNKKEDIAGAKMLKAFHFIEASLKNYGFEINESDIVWNYKRESLLYYFLKKDNLSKEKEILGPPLSMKKHAVLFKKKHNKTLVRKNRLVAIEKRKHTDARSFVKEIIKKPNIKINMAKIKLI
ncbi:nucleotidyltransferase domain-containing protein [Candidatus Woesearchaeota archaeon]|nr:nucleotidyltransferase domain-containing protein [Candidatus Woesearchaeota archaeon]